MGSKPWIESCIMRLLESEKYRTYQEFTIERGSRIVRGTIECGSDHNGPCIFVGDDTTMRLDRQTMIDGIAAPDWREKRDG